MLCRQARAHGLQRQKQYGPASPHVTRRLGLSLVAAGFGFGKKGGSQSSKRCPCGSGQDYQSCCQRYHNSLTIQAPSAEALLRARFSAYAKREWKYIVRTTHPENPSSKGTVSPDGKIRTTFEEDIKVSMYNFEFVQLSILGAEQGASAGEEVLEFQLNVRQKLDDKARKLDKPIPRSIRERALFLRNGEGAWEFRATLDSNWDRDKVDYRGEAQEAATEGAAAS